ncbi:unnamed protein product [[Candida] boidinii]|uniref:Unnamed protein product n=1 Tax=Candida boidinii TaxID=5477 RepID=A0A9W6SV92_CANBO|nr:hypothetical protein B5S30_g4991 [[Candida] boidinii]OWB81403.1 hypothetical protein B5S33_g20 [[Candida] boidinii]GME66942.1 unnamed protein product [[Candida] boidinii]GMF61245.1 unnamed protein product [[Candida] boidinii]GMG07833.1 unnamed protein product [[Candida] boidinii]
MEPYEQQLPSYAPSPYGSARSISINLINQSKRPLDTEIPLYETNKERDKYESLSELYSIIIAINCLEKSYVKDTLGNNLNDYTNAIIRLLNQYNVILKDDDIRSEFKNLEGFCTRFNIDCPLAKKRIQVGIPATIEHAVSMSTNNSNDVNQSTSSFNDMNRNGDARDNTGSNNGVGNNFPNSNGDLVQLERSTAGKHLSGSPRYSARAVAEATGSFITVMDAVKLNYRTKEQLHPLLSDLVTSINRVLNGFEFEGRSKLINWLIKLNNLDINESLSDDESREFLFDLDNAYKGFYTKLE